MEWKPYFNNIVDKVKDKSKDPSSKVGCHIVNAINIVKQKVDFVDNKAIISLHNHNDLGLAVANSLAGIQAGARQIYYNCPGIIRDRGTDIEKEAIKRLILGSGAIVFNVNTEASYIDEININKDEQ